MTQSNSKMHRALSVVLAYILWLASAGLALWLMLQARLLFLVELPMRSQSINRWAFSAIDKFGLFFLGVLWLIFLIVTEEYFRRRVGGRLPVRTIVGVFVVEGVLLGIVYLWRALL
jgi:hypothetical protein